MSTLRSNAIANLLGQVWSALLGLALVPAYLHFLGAEGYGLVGFLISIQALFGVFDVGLSLAANREIARMQAGPPGPRPAAHDLVRTLEIIYALVGIGIALALAALSDWMATSWVTSRALDPETVARAITLFGASLAARWPTALYAAVLRGLESQVLLNWTIAVAATLRGLGAVLVLWLVSPTVTAFLWWTLASGIVEMAVMARAAWRALPAAPEHRAAFDLGILRGTWRFSAALTVNWLLTGAIKHLDKIVIAALLPLEVLGYYTAASTAARGLLILPTAFSGSVFPRFSALMACGDETGLAATYHSFSRVVAAAVAPFAAFLACFSYDVLRVWTGSEPLAENGQVALSLLALAALFSAVLQVSSALQSAAGLLWIQLWTGGLGMLILIPTMWALTATWGISGAAVAWAAFNVASYLVIPQLLHRSILRKEKRLWIGRDTLPFIMGSAVLAGGAWALGRGLGAPSATVALVAIAAAAYVLLFVARDPLLRSELSALAAAAGYRGPIPPQGRSADAPD